MIDRTLPGTEYTRRAAQTHEHLERSRLLAQCATEADPTVARECWDRWCGIAQFRTVGSEELLMPFIFSKLSKAGTLGTDDAFLKERYVSAWMNNELILRPYQTVSGLLADQRIETMVLKGVALISNDRLNDVSLRPFVDVDLLVRPSQYREAIELLSEHGWVSSVVDPILHIDGHHSINLRHGTFGAVDLHREPLHRSHNTSEDDAMWSRSELSAVGVSPLRIPAISDHIVTVIGHSWVGELRAVVDLAFLFSRASSDDLVSAVDSIGHRAMILHSRRVMAHMQLLLPNTELPITKLLLAKAPSKAERIRDGLENSHRLPERAAQWSRQLAYWMNRSQGDSVIARARTLRSFALFNTGTTNLGSAAIVTLRSLRQGKRMGVKL